MHDKNHNTSKNTKTSFHVHVISKHSQTKTKNTAKHIKNFFLGGVIQTTLFKLFEIRLEKKIEIHILAI